MLPDFTPAGHEWFYDSIYEAWKLGHTKRKQVVTIIAKEFFESARHPIVWMVLEETKRRFE